MVTKMDKERMLKRCDYQPPQYVCWSSFLMMGAFSYSLWDKQDSSGCQHLTNGANQGSACALPYPEDFCFSTSQS